MANYCRAVTKSLRGTERLTSDRGDMGSSLMTKLETLTIPTWKILGSGLVTPACDMSGLTLIACRWLNVINKASPILVILESMEHIIHHSISSSIFMYLLPLR